MNYAWSAIYTMLHVCSYSIILHVNSKKINYTAEWSFTGSVGIHQDTPGVKGMRKQLRTEILAGPFKVPYLLAGRQHWKKSQWPILCSGLQAEMISIACEFDQQDHYPSGI